MHLLAFNPNSQLRAVYLGGRLLGFRKPDGTLLSVGTLATRPMVYMKDDKLVVASDDKEMLERICEFAGVLRVPTAEPGVKVEAPIESEKIMSCTATLKSGGVCGKSIKKDGLCLAHLGQRSRGNAGKSNKDKSQIPC